MENNRDQFKATSFWNKFIAHLNAHFAREKTCQMNGKDLFATCFKYFAEFGSTKVTNENILKLCQSLLVTNVVYDITQPSSTKAVFKKSSSVLYRSYEMENMIDDSTVNLRRSNSIISVGSDSIKKAFFGDNSGGGTQCLERRFALMQLLKVLDLSMIQGLVDVCQLSVECNHSNGTPYSWTCERLDMYAKDGVELVGDNLLQVHYNCMQLLLGKDYISFCASDKHKHVISSVAHANIAFSDYKLVDIIKYLSLCPQELMWSNLTEVLQQLPILTNLRSNHEAISHTLKLSLNLLPDKAQHLSYHLIEALHMFITKITDQHTRKMFIFDMSQSLLANNDNEENYDKESVLAFIIYNHEHLLALPEDLTQHILFIKDQMSYTAQDEVASQIFCKRVTTDQYRSNAEQSTEMALRSIYKGLVNREGPYQRLSQSQIKDQLKVFKSTYKDLYSRIMEESA